MTLASILMVSAVLVALLAPLVLERMTLYGARPAVALASWLAALAGTLFFAISAVAILIWPEHAPAEGFADALMRCLAAVQHSAQPWIGEALALVAGASAAAFAVRAVLCARHRSAARSRVHDLHRDVVSIVARHDRSRADVMWLDHPLPMAYSVSGKPGFVVATEGLSSSLSATEREAVLAHERAHLHGHHHRIVNVVEVLADVFPFVPLFARAPKAVRTIIEIAADHHAARATSAAAVGSALTTVTDAALPRTAGTLGLGDDIELRLWRLRSVAPAAHSRFACCVAAVGTLALPALIAPIVVLTVSLATCIAVV
ncbi:M48 family metalloprotease [Rhodococcus hoagii]|nr:M48 family metalloprotease [Prescottella equi]